MHTFHCNTLCNGIMKILGYYKSIDILDFIVGKLNVLYYHEFLTAGLVIICNI